MFFYQKRRPASEQKEESEAFLPDVAVQQSGHYPRRVYQEPWPWVATTVLFAFMFVISILSSTQRSKHGTFEHGFRTEFGPVTDRISLHTVQFTGSLYYDVNGTLHRETDLDGPSYVGAPSKVLDDNWEALIQYRYVAFADSDDSVDPGLRAEAFHDPGRDNMYRIGIDSFHTLHCINKIRKALDWEYYRTNNLESEHNHRLHIEHCLDYLRQSIQCKADLTPIPVYFAAGANHTVPDFNRPHVCRDVGKLRSWLDERHRQVWKTHPTKPWQ